MTAEVGVMNRLGVALAADSAVSVGRDARKIYTSADKLFQLSNTAPVGVMVYGNADFVGVPWETIVKEYRKALGDRRFPKLKEYSDDFLAFLSSNTALFPKERQSETISNLIVSLFSHVRDELKKILDREAEKQDGLEEDDIPPIIAPYVKERLNLIKERDYLLGFTPKLRREIKFAFKDQIAAAKKRVFGDLPMSAAVSRNLSSIATEMITRHYFGPWQCGVVVAGFGDEDFMPRIQCFDIEEMACGLPRCALVHERRIDWETTASIIPFAQQETVHTFMSGIDQNLHQHIEVSARHVLFGVANKILEAVEQQDSIIAQNLKETIGDELNKLIEALINDWRNRTMDHWMPIVEIVSSLPKDELASMAEALVNLTKFRRRVTPEQETVGGPIDVAVITKGDGFVWVKRKHYFDPNLNPRIIARYKN